MATTTNLYQHLLEKFSYYSTDELIQLNNDTILGQAGVQPKQPLEQL